MVDSKDVEVVKMALEKLPDAQFDMAESFVRRFPGDASAMVRSGLSMVSSPLPGLDKDQTTQALEALLQIDDKTIRKILSEERQRRISLAA